MITRDGKIAIMMQHKEEDKAQKYMEYEHWAMTSTTRSECPFLAPFSSVFHTPEIGCHLKSNNLGNGQYVFLRGYFTPSTSGI